MCRSNQSPLAISIQVWNSVRPIHLSVAPAIMIPNSNSSVKRSGTPNHYGGDLLHTMGISRLSRVRTELFQLLVIPPSAPHPVQAHRQSPRHGYFRDLSTSSHRQVEKLIAPSRIAAHRHLRCFHSSLAPFSRALVGLHHQSLLGRGSRHCYGIIALIEGLPLLSNFRLVLGDFRDPRCW